MSNQFNVCLFPWQKIPMKRASLFQPVPWLILNILRKLLSKACHLHKETQWLDILYQVIVLLNFQLVQFSLFPWSEYTNEECQPVHWLILNFYLGCFPQKHAAYTRKWTKLAIPYQVIVLLNVQSLEWFFVFMVWVYQWREPACPWLVFNFLIGGFCQKHATYTRKHTNLAIFCFWMSNQFNVCLFPWPK